MYVVSNHPSEFMDTIYSLLSSIPPVRSSHRPYLQPSSRKCSPTPYPRFSHTPYFVSALRASCRQLAYSSARPKVRIVQYCISVTRKRRITPASERIHATLGREIFHPFAVIFSLTARNSASTLYKLVDSLPSFISSFPSSRLLSYVHTIS